MKFRHVLVLAPHTDDAELGCGGTISKLLRLGCRVSYLVFSSADESLPEGFPPGTTVMEQVQAGCRLGVEKSNIHIADYPVRNFTNYRQDILQDMIDLRDRFDFDLVLLPSSGDVHQDHSVVAQEGVRAFKSVSILGYELPWNNFETKNTCVVKLDAVDVAAKIHSLSCFKSQANRSYMNEDFTRSSAVYKGVSVGSKFAEVHEVVRWVID